MSRVNASAGIQWSDDGNRIRFLFKFCGFNEAIDTNLIVSESSDMTVHKNKMI